MRCISNDGKSTYQSSDYVSGNGPGRDEPMAEILSNIGPIPAGSYSIGGYVRQGSWRRSLTPINGTQTYGRSAFQSHGCPDKNTCSEGCIASPDIQTFNKFLDADEGNNILYVY